MSRLVQFCHGNFLEGEIEEKPLKQGGKEAVHPIPKDPWKE